MSTKLVKKPAVAAKSVAKPPAALAAKPVQKPAPKATAKAKLPVVVEPMVEEEEEEPTAEDVEDEGVVEEETVEEDEAVEEELEEVVEEEEEAPPPVKVVTKKQAVKRPLSPVAKEAPTAKKAKASTTVAIVVRTPLVTPPVEAEEQEEKIEVSEVKAVAVPATGFMAEIGQPSASYIPGTLYQTGNVKDNSVSSIALQFKRDYIYYLERIMHGETVRVNNPDLAMSLYSGFTNKCFTAVEFDKPDKQFLLSKGPKYLSLMRKGGQRGLSGENCANGGLVFLSPLCSPTFFRYGKTVGTGVRADTGKTAKFKTGEQIITIDGANYQAKIDTKPVHPQMIDEDLNNSYAMVWFNNLKYISMMAMHRMLDPQFKQAEKCLVDIKKDVLKDCSKNGKPVPHSTNEWIDALIDRELFRWKAKPSDEDPNSMEIDAKAGVMKRSQSKDNAYTKADDLSKINWWTDDMKDQWSKMGERVRLIPNDLPCYRAHVTEEEGKESGRPYSPIANEDIAFDGSRSNFFFLLAYGFNELTPQNECGFNMRIVGIVYHSEKEEFMSKRLQDIPRVDPRFAIPGASKYQTPTERANRSKADANRKMAAAGFDANYLAGMSDNDEQKEEHAGFASNEAD